MDKTFIYHLVKDKYSLYSPQGAEGYDLGRKGNADSMVILRLGKLTYAVFKVRKSSKLKVRTMKTGLKD